MNAILDWMPQILTAIIALCGATISVTAFMKSLKAEKRQAEGLAKANDDVKITRAGIVEAFKNAVVTKDLKVSINKQVEEILNDHNKNLIATIVKNEEVRTKMMYWCTIILQRTAAGEALSKEQKAEIKELLAMIADIEKLVETK